MIPADIGLVAYFAASRELLDVFNRAGLLPLLVEAGPSVYAALGMDQFDLESLLLRSTDTLFSGRMP